MSITHPALAPLLQRQDLWRLGDRARRDLAGSALATGHLTLDQCLHNGGWPRAALTELLFERPGVGELQLLLPVLAQLSREQLWQVWINPPFIPYAPALAAAGIAPESLLIVRTDPKQQLWACEQALRSAASGAVLYWPALPLRYAELRKLQVAAAAQQSLAFVLRGAGNAAHTSPAALRLQLSVSSADTTGAQLSVQILKQRGGRSGQQMLLPRSSLLDAQTPLHQRETLVEADLAASTDTRIADDTIHRPVAPYRTLIQPIANRRPLRRTFSVRSERHATH